MKIIITFLLALFISSQAYAQSAGEILGKGKIILTYEFDLESFSYFYVAYKNEMYNCRVGSEATFCAKIKDLTKDIEE